MLRFWMLRTFDALICVVHFCLGPTVVYPNHVGYSPLCSLNQLQFAFTHANALLQFVSRINFRRANLNRNIFRLQNLCPYIFVVRFFVAHFFVLIFFPSAPFGPFFVYPLFVWKFLHMGNLWSYAFSSIYILFVHLNLFSSMHFFLFLFVFAMLFIHPFFISVFSCLSFFMFPPFSSKYLKSLSFISVFADRSAL